MKEPKANVVALRMSNRKTQRDRCAHNRGRRDNHPVGGTPLDLVTARPKRQPSLQRFLQNSRGSHGYGNGRRGYKEAPLLVNCQWMDGLLVI